MYRKWKRTAFVIAATVGLYALVGFLILPGIALNLANQQLARYASVPASLARLELNPFTLELSLWGLRIGEDDTTQLGFRRLYADLQVDSLWSGALHLRAVELEGAHGEVLFDQQGSLNLTRLFVLPESEAQEPSGGVFPLRIDRIALIDGSVHFQDLRPSEAVDFRYESLDLALDSFSTLPGETADLRLAASSPSGARIDWSGSVGLSPLASQGHLAVSDAQLKEFWPYVRDLVPLVLEKGSLSLASDYRLDLSESLQLNLSNTAASLADFAINNPAGKPLARLQRLEVTETALDLGQRQVTLGKVRSKGLEAWAARDKDGQLDWQKLLAPSSSAKPAQAAADTPAAPWQVRLLDTQLRGYQLHLADRQPQQPVALEVGPLDLDLRDFDSLGKTPFTLRVGSGIGRQGRLDLAGELGLAPLGAQLKVQLKDIDLRLAQSYIDPFIRLELRSGLLGGELEVALRGSEALDLGVQGNLKVEQLHTLDTLKERDFAKWRTLTLEGLDYRHGDHLEIAAVKLLQPYARVMINEDQTTNLNDLLIPQPASEQPAAPGKPLGLRIGSIVIEDGSANFADFSLRPNFATAIQQLNGRIGTLDSRKPGPARIDIDGKVDRYAPVSITGSVNPFDPLDSLDIATRFQNVELTTLTPYSGKFAGYRIRKGRLNLELQYQVEKKHLKAQNKVVVEQLQLGEKVESPDAVDLPIRLAVALLKDTKGTIQLELPVTGNLDDPQFSVMPIVWQTLRNLVLRAAQAPFKFIGGLVAGGSDVDLGTVWFTPGSAELDEQGRHNLDLLAEALQKRPQLRLEVEGSSAQASDGPLLAEQRLQREFQSTLYKVLQRRGDKVPASAAELEVPEDEQPALLEAIYRSRLKQQPPAEWNELDGEQRLARMREAVLDSWRQSSLLLRQLAQKRSSVVKDYLVEKGQLSDERIYLLDVSQVQPAADGRVAMPLHLDSE